MTDPVGSNSDTVNVTIVDTIAPTIACPANVVVDATATSGAVASYSAPNAADSCSVRSVACVAPSGSTFPVGTNTVQCTVSDFASHTASCSFTVNVKSPAEQAADLIAQINGLPGVQDGAKSSFIAKLNAAIAAIASGNAKPACNVLQALLNAVQAQAASLVADITRIRAALGCS